MKKNSALGNQLNKMYISMQTVIPIPSSMQCPCVRKTFGSSSLLNTHNNCILCFAQKLFTVHVYFFCNGYLTRTFMMTCKCKWFAYVVNWCHILQGRGKSKVCWRWGTLEAEGRGILLGVTDISPSVYNCVKHFRTIANFNFAKPAFVRR